MHVEQLVELIEGERWKCINGGELLDLRYVRTAHVIISIAVITDQPDYDIWSIINWSNIDRWKCKTIEIGRDCG